jgi:hypothetical protein
LIAWLLLSSSEPLFFIASSIFAALSLPMSRGEFFSRHVVPEEAVKFRFRLPFPENAARTATLLSAALRIRRDTPFVGVIGHASRNASTERRSMNRRPVPRECLNRTKRDLILPSAIR